MPVVRFFGEQVRARPMLDAIGAQEALEAAGRSRQGRVMVSPSQERAFERDRTTLARRRNAAERKLRDHERRAWNLWRAADPAARAAGYAVLTDPSG